MASLHFYCWVSQFFLSVRNIKYGWGVFPCRGSDPRKATMTLSVAPCAQGWRIYWHSFVSTLFCKRGEQKQAVLILLRPNKRARNWHRCLKDREMTLCHVVALVGEENKKKVIVFSVNVKHTTLNTNYVWASFLIHTGLPPGAVVINLVLMPETFSLHTSAL